MTRISTVCLPNIKCLQVYSDTRLEGRDIYPNVDANMVSCQEQDGLFIYRIPNITEEIIPFAYENPFTSTAFQTAMLSLVTNDGRRIDLDQLIFKDLPSSYWMDLIDCWSCHKDEFVGVTKSIKLSNGLLLPSSENIVHLGIDFMIIHRDYLEDYLDGNGFTVLDDYIQVPLHWVEKDGKRYLPLFFLFLRLHELMSAHGSHAFRITNGSSQIFVSNINWRLQLLAGTTLAPAISLIVNENPVNKDSEVVSVDETTYSSLQSAVTEAWPSLRLSEGTFLILRPFS